jgi:hypothetical protein
MLLHGFWWLLLEAGRWLACGLVHLMAHPGLYLVVALAVRGPLVKTAVQCSLWVTCKRGSSRGDSNALSRRAGRGGSAGCALLHGTCCDILIVVMDSRKRKEGVNRRCTVRWHTGGGGGWQRILGREVVAGVLDST